HFTRAVAPVMKAQKSGAIVNISSGAGRSYSLPGIQAYASAKAGLIGFTRQTAVELGPFGIRVNCIAPGFIRSNPATEKQWAAMGEAGQRQFVESIALRRLGTADEIARAVVFFACPTRTRKRFHASPTVLRSLPRGTESPQRLSPLERARLPVPSAGASRSSTGWPRRTTSRSCNRMVRWA